ncbi:MAG: substrate-binding domain-containing protein [Clostridiales bacterium]|nr:substrate-binding domain-containing protein [Clostridiales bacterium]
MKKCLAILLCAVLMVLALASVAVAEEKDGYRFVIVPKCVHPWFDEVNKGAVAEAEMLSNVLGVPVEIDYRAPSIADVTEQNSVLQQAAATHPDAIALDPNDYEGSKAVIEEIQELGIPVILFDAPAPEGSGLTSVGNDFAEQAELAANYLVELLGGKGKVAVMQGVPTAPNHVERYEAHIAVLSQYPDIEIIDGGIDNDDIQTAQSQAAAVIAANPDLNGYLCCDASGPIGIANAIREAGKQDQIMAVGMDNLIEILEAVQDGSLKATSSTLPQEQGMFAVLMMLQAANGMPTPAVVDTGIGWYVPGEALDAAIEAMK